LLEANAGRPDVILDGSRGAVFEARARHGSFGRIVAYGISSREPNELRTSDLLRSSHAVVGFWLTHSIERPAMLAGAWRPLRTYHR